MTEQNKWRWCHKCQGMFFSGNPTQGVCPKDKQPHDASQSGEYVAIMGESTQGQQGGWRWCQKCQGMFFSGNPSQGVCPADKKTHDGSQSGHYAIVWEGPAGTQSGWRWCKKCQGFFFAGNPDQGSCPAGGTHDGGASGRYGATWDELKTELTFNFPNVTFDGGVPIGGNATVTVHQNGNYEFKGHFHKSSIVPFSYGIAIGVRDRAGHAYTFAHQYSFGGGVADDDFPYSGNNPAIAQHWPDLVAGASAKLSGSANIDIGGLVALVKSVISYIETAIGAVEGVIAIVGPLVA